jgi:ADP-ribosylglycohydrolase
MPVICCCFCSCCFALCFDVVHRRCLDLAVQALIANAACGGDSGARALVIGTLLGALHGETALPQRWLDTLREYKRADEMLNTLLSPLTAADGTRSEVTVMRAEL